MSPPAALLEKYTSIDEISADLERFFTRYRIAGLLGGLAAIAFTLAIHDVGALLSGAAVFFFIRSAAKWRRDPLPLPPHVNFTIRRDECLTAALEAVESEPGFLLLSGESGVGKSVLTRAIIDAVRASGDVGIVQRDNYGLLRADTLQQDLAEYDPTRRILFVLDQLEKVFLLDSHSSKTELMLLGRIISSCRRHPAWSCVLVVRREWFLNLVVFPELRPMLGEVQVVRGFDPAYEGRAYERFRLHLIDALNDNEELVDTILDETQQLERIQPTASQAVHVVPVKALAAIDALRYLRQQRGVEYSVASYHKEGGFRGIMKLYFSSFLKASGRADDASRILAALSVDPRARRALTDSEVARTTCVPLRTTRQLLDFFTDAKLLQRVGRGYDWIHDFFAESFNDLSGSFLVPAERDNISHSWERISERKAAQTPHGSDEDITGAKVSFWLFGFSALLLWSRTLVLPWVKGLSATPWSSPMYHPVDFLPATVVDASFVPVALALTAWSWYTTALLRRVFSRLGEPAFSRRFSYFVAIASTVLVCLSIAYPRWWVTFTGVGGLLVGLKYLEVGSRMGRGWRRTELFFGRAGWSTCLNCLILVVLGVIFAQAMAGAYGPLGSARATLLSLGTMVLMLCFAFVASLMHISKSRVPLLVGMYRRYSAS